MATLGSLSARPGSIGARREARSTPIFSTPTDPLLGRRISRARAAENTEQRRQSALRKTLEQQKEVFIGPVFSEKFVMKARAEGVPIAKTVKGQLDLLKGRRATPRVQIDIKPVPEGQTSLFRTPEEEEAGIFISTDEAERRKAELLARKALEDNPSAKSAGNGFDFKNAGLALAVGLAVVAITQ